MSGFEEIEDYVDREAKKGDALWRSDRQLIDALLDLDAGLQPEEVDFIDSVNRWLEPAVGRVRVLTRKQRAWAVKIAMRMGV